MAVYQKVAGAWAPASRVYVRRNGVWTSVSKAYVKRSGVWVEAFNYDVTPPSPPEISLQLVDEYAWLWGNDVKTLVSRYIKVGVRQTGASDDPNVDLIRVLTDYNGAPPTTQFGGTYTSASDPKYPDEPWSEWRYSGSSGLVHADTSVEIFKLWPRGATNGTLIKGDTTFHFTGWTLDTAGNWSNATKAAITTPKDGVGTPKVVTKEARFQPNSTGTWYNPTGFQSGDLIQQKSPRGHGLWFYGSQFVDTIGAETSGPERINVVSSQIRIHRLDDNGQPNANVYLFWTTYGSPGALPNVSTGITKNETAKLGSIAKGQTKWFDLPASFHNNLNKLIKGLGLDWKDPNKADAMPDDYSEVPSSDTHPRCGEVHIVWEETL